MYRKIMNSLVEWKNNKNNKPLIVLGARQVGKTYIIDEFCKNNYKNYFKINLYDDERIIDLYKSKLTSKEKFDTLKTIINIDLDNKDSILFVDEAQKSKEFISGLKYINENHPNANIILAGSLLGVMLKKTSKSYPVGQVNKLLLYPMDFEEFLIAIKKEYLIDQIKSSFKNNKQMLESLHEEALKYYRTYLCIGGMPESIQNFIDNNCELVNVDTNIAKSILDGYVNDMTQYATPSETVKINKVYDVIPSQLKSQNKKFFMNKVDKDARIRDYITPINWLSLSKIVLTSNLVKEPYKPLYGMKSDDDYKLFYSDVGLLVSKLDCFFSDIISDCFDIYKGALTENYVAEELVSKGFNLYYWTSSYDAEVDFLIETKDGVIPIEVKSSDNTQSKSLKSYVNQYNSPYSIRISTKNFAFVNNIKSIPIYATFCISKDM